MEDVQFPAILFLVLEIIFDAVVGRAVFCIEARQLRRSGFRWAVDFYESLKFYGGGAGYQTPQGFDDVVFFPYVLVVQDLQMLVDARQLLLFRSIFIMV